ncbi:MAG: glutaminyl-peptide cyclotransferase [Thermoguttaceae bacterium]|nr:glutaminyl-peptide cyclotransferase [Thermoguttaceae bacterium]
MVYEVKTVWLVMLFTSFFLLCAGTAGKGNDQGRTPDSASVRLNLIRTLPHNTDDYCQGLTWDVDATGKGFLCESTGRYGKSKLKTYDPETGKVTQSVSLHERFFGEGHVRVGNRVYMLTWQERTCLVFDTELKQLDEFRYPGEGWGLTFDGTNLVMSDGSDVIRFLTTDSFREVRRLKVFYRQNGKKTPLRQINELEWIDGEIWANIYETNYLVRISPVSGEVLQFLNCQKLVPQSLQGDRDFVFNGIAWDQQNRRLYLTGKCWPVMYELTFQRTNNER